MHVAELPQPRIKVHAFDLWSVDFGNGARAEIWIDETDRSAWPSKCHRWRLFGVGDQVLTGYNYSRDLAMRSTWCLAASRSAPPRVDLTHQDVTVEGLATAHLHAARLGQLMAYRAERARSSMECSEILRTLLLKRTGFRWSVRSGAGTSRAIITISALPTRQVNKAMSAHDTALLAAVLQEPFVNAQGYGLGTRTGDRARTALAILGVPKSEFETLDWSAMRQEFEQLAAPPGPTIH